MEAQSFIDRSVGATVHARIQLIDGRPFRAAKIITKAFSRPRGFTPASETVAPFGAANCEYQVSDSHISTNITGLTIKRGPARQAPGASP